MILWKQAIMDRTQDDIDYLNNLKSVGWNNLTDDQKEIWIYRQIRMNLCTLQVIDSVINGVTISTNREILIIDGTATKDFSVLIDSIDLPSGYYEILGAENGSNATFGLQFNNISQYSDKQYLNLNVDSTVNVYIVIKSGTTFNKLNLVPSIKTAECIGLKGAFNYYDMFRIENNIQLLSDVLELGLSTYSGNIPDYPHDEYFAKMVSNVEAIRKAYIIHATTPITPSIPVNGFQKVNDIEHILNDIYSILMSNFFYYSTDDVYCGQDFGLLL